MKLRLLPAIVPLLTLFLPVSTSHAQYVQATTTYVHTVVNSASASLLTNLIARDSAVLSAASALDSAVLVSANTNATALVAAEAILRSAADATNLTTAFTNTTALVTAESLLRISGDASTLTNALAAVAAEALLRSAGDASTLTSAQEYVASVLPTATVSHASTATSATTVTGPQSNLLASATQPEDLPTSTVAYATSAGTAGTVTGVQSNLIDSAVQAEADTLQSVVTRGGTVTSGPVTIDAANVSTNTYGGHTAILASRIQQDTCSATGPYGSLALGNYARAAGGYGAAAIGYNVSANGDSTVALGDSANALDDLSFVWSGTVDGFTSQGLGTFSINPAGGANGFYIGSTSLGSLLDAKATPAQATNIAEAAASAAQAYAGTLMQTGTAARATSADYATVAGVATNATYATSAGTAGVATNATYVLGPEAWITMSGTTGLLYKVETNTNVIRVVSNSVDYNGPMGPWILTETTEFGQEFTSSGSVISSSFPVWDNSWSVNVGDLTFFYTRPYGGLPVLCAAFIEEAVGTVTLDWGLATNAYAIATTADLDAALEGYSTNGHGHVIADVTGLQDALDSIPDEAEIESIAEAAASAAVVPATNALATVAHTGAYADLTGTPTIPGPGVTVLSGVTPTITGATIYYDFAATNAYTLSVSANAPRYGYSVLISGTNAITLGTGISWEGNAAITPALTNRMLVVPEGATNWNAIGRAY